MEPPSELSEIDRQEALWLRQLGDSGFRDAALRALVGAYDKRFIPRLARRGFFGQEREDVLQNIWLGIVKSARTFRDGAKPSAWMWRIARNKINDALRGRYRTDHKTISYDDEANAAEVDAAILHRSPQGLTESLEDCYDLALARFSAKHSDDGLLLDLFVREGWSLKDIREYVGSDERMSYETLRQIRLRFKPFYKPCLDLLNN